MDRIRDLDGAAEMLAWIALANVIVVLGVLVAVSIRKTPPPWSWTMAFVVAVAAVYTRSTYRNLTGASITYAGALIHVGIAAAGLGMLVAVLRRDVR